MSYSPTSFSFGDGFFQCQGYKISFKQAPGKHDILGKDGVPISRFLQQNAVKWSVFLTIRLYLSFTRCTENTSK